MAANEAADEQKPEAYPLGYVEDFLRVENEAWELARLGATGLGG